MHTHPEGPGEQCLDGWMDSERERRERREREERQLGYRERLGE